MGDFRIQDTSGPSFGRLGAEDEGVGACVV